MHIRNFVPTDLGAVMRLVAETFKQDYSPSMYLTLHAQWPDGFLVASEEGVLTGLLLGTRASPDEARILIMATKKELRYKGVGSSLLNTFFERCGWEGICSVVLEVRTSNTIAQEFYTKRGFQVVSLLERYYLDGEDGIMMTNWI
ncbi:MAG: hypothetical protein AYK23_02485 [Candidatus Proteinoplasmatales archaeon SG8-5]|nr:MAG: hypothetical protein AYK23_02485 [Candidatus Proteinoplasmatales archaeon SG8-5]